MSTRYEAALYLAMIALLLGLMCVEKRAASEDTARNTDVRASVVEDRQFTTY